MGAMKCPKHVLAGWVTCCPHVAEAVYGDRPFAEAQHGPRKTFRWCACSACAAAPQMPFCGVADSLMDPRGVCLHCFYDWWSVHQSSEADSPPAEWARPAQAKPAEEPRTPQDAEPVAGCND